MGQSSLLATLERSSHWEEALRSFEIYRSQAWVGIVDPKGPIAPGERVLVKLQAKQPAEVGGGEEQQKPRPAPKEQETPRP